MNRVRVQNSTRRRAVSRSGQTGVQKTRSESKQYKGIGRLEDRTGRVDRQVGSARVETRRTRTKRVWEKNRSKEKRWLTWQTRRTGIERQKTQGYIHRGK